ncbi:hypothetical protein RB195_018913 [Necator americanus]|uniref:Sphingomyelin synthase-like domain-containing protein n=1 Tax=Necator americanus TaxID=51031 RepID=A0ABR1CFF2_NECAM
MIGEGDRSEHQKSLKSGFCDVQVCGTSSSFVEKSAPCLYTLFSTFLKQTFQEFLFNRQCYVQVVKLIHFGEYVSVNSIQNVAELTRQHFKEGRSNTFKGAVESGDEELEKARKPDCKGASVRIKYQGMLDKEKREILPTSVTKFCVVRRLPTLVSLALVGVGWLLNEVALAWIHERVPRDTTPLPDLWFSWFPEVKGAIRITEYIMLILVVNTLVIIVTHQHRWIVSRRVFFCAALSYCFRALCITIFQVPVPSVHTYCAPKTNGSFYIVSARVARMFWSAGIEQLRPRELCGDLIVSGHTVTIFTSFYAFKHYAPKKLKPLSYMFNVLAIMAVVAILFARKHYTIDVVLGKIEDFPVNSGALNLCDGNFLTGNAVSRETKM